MGKFTEVEPESSTQSTGIRTCNILAVTRQHSAERCCTVLLVTFFKHKKQIKSSIDSLNQNVKKLNKEKKKRKKKKLSLNLSQQSFTKAKNYNP